MNGDQLAELESRIAFQDQALLELNDALVKQGELLSAMEIRLNDMARRLQLVEDRPDSPGSAEERPPHY